MQPDRPLLSIIVPNYNNELYLPDCLESILNQTYENFEIVISDDASSDRSTVVIRRYEQLYSNIIKGLYHDKNRGVSCNRHAAIVAARGEFITTLDSDDYYCDTEKLEKEMEVVLTHRRKDGKDVCAFSNIVQVTGDKELIQVVGTSENICQGNIFEGIITRSCFIPRDFILLKTAYFDVGGFDPMLKIYEDWDLKIRLSAKYEFYYTGINGIGYRLHGSGLSSAPVKEHLDVLEKIFEKNLNQAPVTSKQSLSERFNSFLTIMREQSKSDVSEQLPTENSRSLFTIISNKFRSLMS